MSHRIRCQRPSTVFSGRLSTVWKGALAALFVLGATSVQAQRLPPDPVKEFQTILKDRISYPSAADKDQEAERKRLLQHRTKQLDDGLAKLRTISQMRGALMLPDWRTDSLFGAETNVELEALKKLRTRMRERLTALLNEKASSGSNAELRQVAAVKIVGQMPLDDQERNKGIGTFITEFVGEDIAPILMDVLKSSKQTVLANPQQTDDVRVEAIRALGKINPKNVEMDVIKAIEEALKLSPGEATQQAAMEARAQMVAGLVPLLESTSLKAADAPTRLIRVSGAVLPGLLDGLKRANSVAVRRHAVNGMGAVLTDLLLVTASLKGLNEREYDFLSSGRKTFSPAELEKISAAKKRVADQLMLIKPLVESLAKQMEDLTLAVEDPDPVVRSAAHHVLEDVAYLRKRFAEQIEKLPEGAPNGGKDGGGQVQQPFDLGPYVTTARKSIPTLRKALSVSKTAEERVLALRALGKMDRLAESAVPDVAPLTSDANPFVRWAAARTLGTISDPKAPASGVIERLVGLIDDPDVDVRRAALKALTRFEPTAKVTSVAVPALAKEIENPRRDDEIRVEHVKTVVAMGEAGAKAIPAVIKALDAEGEDLQVEAAKTLGRFGALARAAIPALRRALNSPEQKVRQAASDALLAVTPE